MEFLRKVFAKETKYNRKGVSLLEREKYDEAIKCFEKALEINPNSHIALRNRGLVFERIGMMKLNEKIYDGAIEALNQEIVWLDKSLEVNPEYQLALKTKAAALNSIGVSYYRKHKYVEARSYFDKSLEISPNDQNTINNRADTIEKIENMNKTPEELELERLKHEEGQRRTKEIILEEFRKRKAELEYEERKKSGEIIERCSICGKVIPEEKMKKGVAFQSGLLDDVLGDNLKYMPNVLEGKAMRCNRCHTWICGDCAQKAALSANAGILEHSGCGGKFENP